MTFKEKVVKLRMMKGLTQDECASAVGVSRQAVYKWESGQSYPEVSKLLEMKILFNISIDDLLDENYEVVVPEKKKKRVSKEVKQEIEKAASTEIKEETIPVEETVPASEPVIEAPKATEENSPVAEVKEEVVAPVAEAVEEPAKAEKKVGFFGKIFGRK